MIETNLRQCIHCSCSATNASRSCSGFPSDSAHIRYGSVLVCSTCHAWLDLTILLQPFTISTYLSQPFPSTQYQWHKWHNYNLSVSKLPAAAVTHSNIVPNSEANLCSNVYMAWKWESPPLRKVIHLWSWVALNHCHWPFRNVFECCVWCWLASIQRGPILLRRR